MCLNMYTVLYSPTVEAHSSHPLHHEALFLIPSTCVCVCVYVLALCSLPWQQWSVWICLCHVSPHLCLHPRACVWKPGSVCWPGYFFGYLPQWPPWDGCKCVCVLCHWPACFSAGPVFSDYARFHGLAVFIDTYSNDDATDVSGGSGLIRRHADFFPFSFEFSRRTGMSSESTSTLEAFKLILLIFTYLSRQPQS